MFLQFVFSLFLLLNGSNLLINGALSLGKKFNISNLVLGIFVVALGTSFPELFVLLSSIFKNEPLLGVVNIFSSSIFNLCLILAISSFFVKIDLKERVLKSEIPFNLLFSFLLLLFFGLLNPGLQFYDGVFLLLCFSFFCYKLFHYRKGFFEPTVDIKVYSFLVSLLLIITGSIFMFLGSSFLVDSVVLISDYFQIDKKILSATLIAFGTSAPEIFTSFIIIKKKDVDLLLGNLIGSNIFNLSFVLGLGAIFKTLPFVSNYYFDIFILIFSKFLIIIFYYFSPSKYVTAPLALLLLMLSVFYIFGLSLDFVI